MLTVLHLTFPREPFLMRWEMAGQVIESEVGLFIDTGPYKKKKKYEVGHSMSLGQGRGWIDSFAPMLRLTILHLP